MWRGTARSPSRSGCAKVGPPQRWGGAGIRQPCTTTRGATSNQGARNPSVYPLTTSISFPGLYTLYFLEPAKPHRLGRDVQEAITRGDAEETKWKLFPR